MPGREEDESIQGGYALAVDLGGTKVEAALVDAEGELLPDARFRAGTGRSSTNASLETAIREVVGRARAALPESGRLVGAGIGSAGPLDLEAGTTSPLNLPDVSAFPIRDIVEDAAGGVPTRLALDGLCITLAEHWLGAGRGVGSVLGMVVSTGIGGGLIIGGRILQGATGNAGHIGQVQVAGLTDPGVGGLDATAERVASGPNIVAWAQGEGWEGATGEDLAASYRAGDPVAIAAVQRSATAVASAITSAQALVDIDLAVIGGGFSFAADDYLDRVRGERDRLAAFPFLARARISRPELGSDAPLVGAAALVLRDVL